MSAASKSRFEERTRTVQKKLAERDVDALVLSKGVNMYYLSGFFTTPQKRHLFLFVPQSGDPHFFIPSPYENQVRDASWVDNLTMWEDSENPLDSLESTVDELGLANADHVLVNEGIWGMYLLDLMKVMAADFDICTEVLMELRMTKDERELDSMREAAAIADAVSEEVRALDPVGMTENELAAEIQFRLRKHGADGGNGATVTVASGPNSANPPHNYSDRTIEAGDPVVLDFGCNVGGYLSDQARSVVFGGDPPSGYLDAHALAREAQDAAIDAIEPGMEAREVDAVARSMIEDAGYEGKFLHVTGHGLGLGIHEPPYLMSGSYLHGGNEIQLQPGMVVTVEPGIYLDEWGIRIEEMVKITEDGTERLTNTDRGWRPA